MTLQEFKKLPWIQNFKEEEWHLTVQIPTSALTQMIQHYQRVNKIQCDTYEDAIRNTLGLNPVSIGDKQTVLRLDELIAFNYIDGYNSFEILFWDLDTREMRLLFS